SYNYIGFNQSGYLKFLPTQQTGLLQINPADKTETGSVALAWKPTVPPSLALQSAAILQPQTGKIHFTDTDAATLPFASIVGSPVITAISNRDGQPVTLAASQIALLQTAFTITPEPGNNNNGVIDWTFNYQGGVGDLNFIAGRTITVKNTVQVQDQDGNT